VRASGRFRYWESVRLESISVASIERSYRKMEPADFVLAKNSVGVRSGFDNKQALFSRHWPRPVLESQTSARQMPKELLRIISRNGREKRSGGGGKHQCRRQA
jgi:hypothetical protein